MRTCCLLSLPLCAYAAVTVFWAQRPVVTETIVLAALLTPRSQHHSGRKSFWLLSNPPLLLRFVFTLLAFNTSGPISAQRKMVIKMVIYGIRGSLFINSQSASHFCRKGQVLDPLLRAGRLLFALVRYS